MPGTVTIPTLVSLRLTALCRAALWYTWGSSNVAIRCLLALMAAVGPRGPTESRLLELAQWPRSKAEAARRMGL